MQGEVDIALAKLAIATLPQKSFTEIEMHISMLGAPDHHDYLKDVIIYFAIDQGSRREEIVKALEKRGLDTDIANWNPEKAVEVLAYSSVAYLSYIINKSMEKCFESAKSISREENKTENELVSVGDMAFKFYGDTKVIFNAIAAKFIFILEAYPNIFTTEEIIKGVYIRVVSLFIDNPDHVSVLADAFYEGYSTAGLNSK